MSKKIKLKVKRGKAKIKLKSGDDKLPLSERDIRGLLALAMTSAIGPGEHHPGASVSGWTETVASRLLTPGDAASLPRAAGTSEEPAVQPSPDED